MTTLHTAAAAWTADEAHHLLLERGYCILEDALPSDAIAALDRDLNETFNRTPFGAGGFYGDTTKRFGRLLARSRLATDLIRHPVVLDAVTRVLSPHCDVIQLNVAQAIAVHPGAPQQVPHRDQDMWRAPVGGAEYLVNVMWPLTPFRKENGATVVWPDTHGARALDPAPPSLEEGVAAEMDPGSALLFLGSTLHGAGANRSRSVRRGAVIGYSLGWLKTYENQFLAYPPTVARSFPPEVAALVGYRQHRPNIGNYEGRCPSLLLGDAVPDHIGAVDALRPDQAEMVAAWVAEQRPS